MVGRSKMVYHQRDQQIKSVGAAEISGAFFEVLAETTWILEDRDGKVPVFVGGIWMFWSGSMAEGPQSLDFAWVHHGKIVGSHTYEPPSAIGRTGKLRFLRFILSWNAQGFLDAIFQAFWKVEGRLFVATIPIRHFWTWFLAIGSAGSTTNSCNTKATKWDSQEISELVRVYDSNNYGLWYLQLYGVKLGGHIGAIQHLFLSDDRLSSPLRG